VDDGLIPAKAGSIGIFPEVRVLNAALSHAGGDYTAAH
jgi:hypothetical protein